VSPKDTAAGVAGTGGSIPVLERYDALVMDLDGVVYRGDRVVPGAAAALPEVRRRGVPVVFLTNNSARTPQEVAARLVGMGIQATPDEILTSALATATMLRGQPFDGSPPDPTAPRVPMTAFVIGEQGIRDALTQAGVDIVDGEPDRTDLVVVGWDRHADYDRLRTASLLVQRGARLVATNPDASYPAPDGLWPGAGALLAVVTTTTGATPTVVGKPNVPMFEAAAAMSAARRPLMVGDRLDTDIAGASAAGWDSMLVLTGASRTQELPMPSATALPTYLGADLGAVLDDRIPARPRPCSGRDLPTVRALLEATALPPDDAGERTEGTIVIEIDGDPPGSIAATARLTAVDGHPYLRSVAVTQEARGQGLGLLVAAAALRQAPGGDARTPPTYLLTEGGEGFFRRLGFVPVARSDLPDPIAATARDQGCGTSATAMVLAPGG